MDAHEPVTLEEGDRYPLGPPSYVSLVSTAARQSPKLLVGVRIPGGTPNNGAIVYRSGHKVFILGSGVRFPVALPNTVSDIVRGIPICRSSSLGGQRIVYPIKASSILVYGASYVQVAERPNATVCKTVRPWVRLPPWIPMRGSFNGKTERCQRSVKGSIPLPRTKFMPL